MGQNGKLGMIRLSVDAQYRSEVWALNRSRMIGSVNNEKVGSFTVVNSRLSYAVPQLGKKGEVFVAIENLFDPETIILGGLAPASLAAELARVAGELPNSVAARRDRKAPRLIVSNGGPHTVLRGAAALAVAGVLSPRFGQLFAPGNTQLKGLAA